MERLATLVPAGELSCPARPAPALRAGQRPDLPQRLSPRTKAPEYIDHQPPSRS